MEIPLPDVSIPMIDSYCIFFKDAIWGSDKADGKSKEIFHSQTVLSSIHSDISNIMNEHTQSIDENAYSSQKISVNCSAQIPNTPFYTTNTRKRYDFFGNEIIDECSDEPEWGCCYDVTQLSNIKLKAINNSVLNDKQTMFNKIKQNVESQVSLTVAGNKNIKDYQDAVSTSESASINNITNILESAINMEVNSDQSVTIESTVPLRCSHRCGEMPSAGNVDQETQIEIYSKNIASTVLSEMQKNYDSLSVSSKVSFKDVSFTKRMIFISLTIIFLIFVIIDIPLLGYSMYKLKDKGPIATPIIITILTLLGLLISSITLFLLSPQTISFLTTFILLFISFIVGIIAIKMDFTVLSSV